MRDIPGYEGFMEVVPVDKGWSSDRKYRITTRGGDRWLLRLADADQQDRKRAEYDALSATAGMGFLQSEPVDFGLCCEGKNVYTLLTWIDGEEAETAIPSLSRERQYALGLRAGEILRHIHSLPAPSAQPAWEPRFLEKLHRKMEQYRQCPIQVEGGEAMLRYCQENAFRLAGRPQSLQHGDYHVGNMIVTPDGELGIIDFNRFDYGDPWEEFNRIPFCAARSPAFAAGRIDGYFHGDPPEEFFRLLALYICSNSLSSIPWAIPFGDGEISVMTKQMRDILSWYDGMRAYVPSWYAQGRVGADGRHSR